MKLEHELELSFPSRTPVADRNLAPQRKLNGFPTPNSTGLDIAASVKSAVFQQSAAQEIPGASAGRQFQFGEQ